MPQVWVLLSHAESDISISYHHWNLRWVLKPSPTSLKSQDTLNIFRRTRGYPSVLRKVWPVYCSNTITAGTPFSYLLFDFIKEKVFRISLSRIFNLISDFYEFEINHSQIRMLANTVLNSFWSHLLHYAGKKNDQTFLEIYFVCRWLICLFERTVQIIKFYRGIA